MKIKIDKKFNLKDTVTCGQIFRYFIEEDNSYTIIIKDRVFNVKQEDNDLIVNSNDETKLKELVLEYFDLNRDYDEIHKELINKDKKMKEIIEFCDGVKIINEDPFITIISYIISANNSVKSITNSLNLIANKYGKKILFNSKEYYLFPSSKDLKNVSEEEFRTFKVGFRDKYLVNIINSINTNIIDLDYLNKLSSDDLMDLLMSYNGIGTKVASCICLFAYKRLDVFPIDTWVKKMMSEEYDLNTQEKIKEYAKKTYKEYSGLAIQYMFHYKRNK